MLIGAPWPDACEFEQYIDDEAEASIQVVCDIVSAVRSARARYGVSPKEKLNVYIKAEGDTLSLINTQSALAIKLANIDSLEASPNMEKPQGSSVGFGEGVEIYVDLVGIVDFEEEKKRLKKELESVTKDFEKFEKKLSNPGFLAKAAPEIIEKDKARLAELTERKGQLETQIDSIG